MTSKTLFGKLALAGCALIAAAQIGRAQVAATLTDLGATAPTPGPNDQSQMVVTTLGAGSPGGLNYYWDSGHPGQTFTTGNNPGGYVLNSVAFKGNFGNGSAASTSQAFILCVYQMQVTNSSGVTLTNAAGQLTNAVQVAYYQSQNVGLTMGDWYQFTGLSVPMLPNTQYAYMFNVAVNLGNDWQNLAWTNGNLYAGGSVCSIPVAGGYANPGTATAADATFDVGLALPAALTIASPTISASNPVQQGTAPILTCGTIVDNTGNGTYTYQWQTDGGGGGTLTNIPGATGTTFTLNTAAMTPGLTYNYRVKVTDSVAASANSASLPVNVIQVISGTLTDLGGPTPPTPGGADAYQLDSAYTYQSSGGLNYYDNSTPAMGQTFTTGGNAKGYSMNAVAIEMAGGTASYPGNVNGQGPGNTNQAYDLRIYYISPVTGLANQIADVTNLLFSFANGDWIQWAFPVINLTNNATYAYTFQIRNTSDWCGMSTSDGSQDWYNGGQAVGIPNGGGTVTYSTGTSDGTFDVTLLPNGVPFLLSPVTVTPNPAYALSTVTLGCRPSTAGPNGYTFTYQWFAEDDLNGIPSTPIPGATATNVTVVPMDLFPGNGNNYAYPTNYYFVATDTTTGNSVTSSVVTLNVFSASGPVLTNPTPASLITYVGASPAFTVGEGGTLPITNQWQVNYGSGYVPVVAGTSSTLVLNNVQTTNSGNYELMATNLVGGSNTLSAVLTVLADPAAPNPASQIYFNRASTNNAWAYWRLNETGNPATTTMQAYDYSGHGFLATYGSAMTVNNPGPVPPSFPGFDAGELAAGGVVSTASSYLTVPSLHLNGNSNVTFMAWINPGGAQAANAGLLFYRNAADAAGFGFGPTSGHLGYTWNNSAATYNWDSGLVPVVNQWNFVAYVITPTNTTVYLGNLVGGTNFYQSLNPVANAVETFTGGTVLLGSDPNSVNQNFNGLMCEATLFTNALTTLQVQQYFQTAIGAVSLPPTVSALTVAPVAATTTGVYSGQNVRMSAGNASGTFPITNRWQLSADGTTWSDVSGITANTLLINPQTVGTIHYQLVVGNIAATVTSAPVVVTFNALPATPPGLWTVNFQTTNNIGPGQSTISGGLGQYVGRGILGNGMYWNPVPQLLGGYSAGSVGSVSGLQDNGVTNSGIYCFMGSGGAYNSLGASGGESLTYSSDIGNLLDQFYRTYYSGGGNNSALRFFGVPAGTYNLVCYSGNGVTINGAANLGSMFIVYDSINGNQTNLTAEATPVTDALSQGVNFVVFQNVATTNGIINVDVITNAATGGSAIIEGAQLQLVSYSSSAPPVPLTGQYTPKTATTPSTMSFNWSQGVLQSTTNLLSPWTTLNAPAPGLAGALGTAPYSVTWTNGTQFFRVQVHP